MQHASSPEGYVLAKTSSVAAQLMKRGWLEFSAAEKETFLYQVQQAITGSHGLDVKYRGINFLECLISEFSPSTSTAMGLPREFHDQCQASLERNYLKTFYSWAQDAGLSVSDKIIHSESAVPEVNACSAALLLMVQILNWDFRSNSSADGAKKQFASAFQTARSDNSSPKRSECVIVQPGPSWCDVLLTSGHVEWLLSLYNALRQKFSHADYWMDCPIAVSARKLIVQLCSLTGTIFTPESGHMQEQHLLRLLSGTLAWIDPPEIISKEIECGRSESEMLDGCRALLAIATVTTPLVFDQLLKSTRPFGTVTFLAVLMCEVTKAIMTNYTDEERWCWVARDILLDTWTAVLVPTDANRQNVFLSQEGIVAAANLFSLIVESELKVASLTAFGDDDENEYRQASVSAMDERLTSYALIGRAAIDFTVPLLTRLFSELIAKLHQGRGICDPTETLEELYTLLLVIGHVLSDDGEGETPLVPKAIQVYSTGTVEIEKHPVNELSSLIIRFAEQSLDAELRASFFSPRLMEAIIWFLARWSQTYLFPPIRENHQLDGSNKSWFSFFFGDQGKLVLNVVLSISKTTFISYPGEKELQALTCYQLLHGLVRRRDVCVQLVTLESWNDIAYAFANEKSLFSLNAAHQRSLAQSLVLSASGMKSLEASNQFVRHLMGPLTGYLLEMSGKNDIRNVAHQPDVILYVSCLFERFRGAASASEPRTQKAIYEMGFAIMSPVLTFLEIYKHEFAVVYMLLKFVVDWVEGQIIYLETEETAAVVNFCMCLLQIYSSHNIGKISLSLSSTLLSEANTEKYKDLRALLQLLTHLCSKDLVDFSSESIDAQGINISKVVYLGLHIVTPLISLDLLKYPKLCHDYFSLLSHMLEVYPEMVAQLNNESFSNVLGTLDFSLHHQDLEVVHTCLSSLKALASYHYKETADGKVGLGSHATGHTDRDGKLQEGILSRFLRSLLQFLLYEDYSIDLISSAADALLPLILCEQGLYQRLAHELTERQTNLMFKSRLTNALQSLTSSNNLSTKLDRPNYQKFRKNLHNFLIEVRGFLRTM
ncbi:exportin-4 isoform X1 [Impatiens glandulifera]|nr:exportin-4 isoform X1 [Impatiens glandulifera]